MFPFEVTIVAWYSLAVLMVIAGAALYVWTLAGAWSGASTAPKVVFAQSANGIVGAAVGDGVAETLGLGVAVGVGVGSAGSGALAPLTPMAIATTATITTPPDPSTNGRRRLPPDGSLMD